MIRFLLSLSLSFALYVVVDFVIWSYRGITRLRRWRKHGPNPQEMLRAIQTVQAWIVRFNSTLPPDRKNKAILEGVTIYENTTVDQFFFVFAPQNQPTKPMKPTAVPRPGNLQNVRAPVEFATFARRSLDAGQVVMVYAQPSDFHPPKQPLNLEKIWPEMRDPDWRREVMRLMDGVGTFAPPDELDDWVFIAHPHRKEAV